MVGAAQLGVHLEHDVGVVASAGGETVGRRVGREWKEERMGERSRCGARINEEVE